MTIDHPVRRLLARFCSPDTMARIVDPTLGDMRFERGRPTWRGYLALARALSLHAITSIPGAVSRVYSDDRRAIPRAATYALLAALVAALALVALPVVTMMRRVSTQPVSIQAVSFEAWLLLIPQALVLTLPAGLLLAFPLAFKGRQRTRMLTRRAILLALVYVIATGALMVWGVPRANQAFRVLLINPRGHLAPGPTEMGFVALREQIDVLKLTPGGRVAARPLEFLYYTKIALIVAPLPLGVLALGLASTPLGRRRPWLIGTSAVIAYIGVLFPLYLAAGVLLRVSSVPPPLLAWLPTSCLVLLAATAARFSATVDRAAAR